MKVEIIEKPSVPQFVADWLESLHDEGEDRYVALGIILDFNGLHYDKAVYDWVADNKDEFIIAVRYGYDIQVESLYYARIKGWELIGYAHETMYWMFDKTNNSLYVSGTYKFKFHAYDEHSTKFTIDEWNKLGINDTNADFEEV